MYPYYCGFMCFYFKLSLVRLSCVYRVVACLMLGSVAMCTGTVSLKIELLIFIGIILTLMVLISILIFNELYSEL